MKKINYITILCFAIILSSCGFHLRGYNNTSYKFPFKTVYVQCNNIAICNDFTTMIKTDDLAKLTLKPESAEAIIYIFNEQTSREPQSFNAAGRISAYNLTYQVYAKILKNKVALGNPIHVLVKSIMQYNDATILADTTEETNFWINLHQSATSQLARKIVYFNTTPSSSNNNESE